MGKKILIEMEIPDTCGECQFYSETPYQCHNERGNEANCGKGYMNGEDMRDISFRNKKYPGCGLEEDSK